MSYASTKNQKTAPRIFLHDAWDSSDQLAASHTDLQLWIAAFFNVLVFDGTQIVFVDKMQNNFARDA